MTEKNKRKSKSEWLAKENYAKEQTDRVNS